MDSALQLAVSGFTSPILIFFLVGCLLALMSRDLTMPPMISKALAFFLVFSIGVKGAANLGGAGDGAQLIVALVLGLGLAVVMTALAFGFLQRMVKLNRTDAAAVAASYGSISIVTFAAMSVLLKTNGIAFDGWMVVVAALMKAPALLAAVAFARLPAPATMSVAGGGAAALAGASGGGGGFGRMIGTIAQDRMVQLLLGAFTLGLIAGELGIGYEQNIAFELFPVLLCIFLLDQGLVVGRRLYRLAKRFDKRLLPVAIGVPLLGGMIAVLLGTALGLSTGNTALLATLAASASYLSAPAAIRAALPGARPELFTTFPLCVTLPFNLVIGLPLYLAASAWLAG
ncbi:MAG: sodium-dependent bicarbonate transport family permease [Pseudomonadota bacterium]